LGCADIVGIEVELVGCRVGTEEGGEVAVIKALVYEQLDRDAASALTSGRSPLGAAVDESLRPIHVLTRRPPRHVTTA
jgi:hypothetical protein